MQPENISNNRDNKRGQKCQQKIIGPILVYVKFQFDRLCKNVWIEITVDKDEEIFRQIY